MKLLLDSANLEEIELLTKTSAIAGVTTNPALMAKEEPGNYVDRLVEIVNILKKGEKYRYMHLSVEPTSVEPEEIYNQGMEIINRLNPLTIGSETKVMIHVKVPVTLANLEIITRFTSFKVDVNATACMTALQAKLASDAGAKIVSFFYNRIKDHSYEREATNGQDPRLVLDEYDGLAASAKVICGSIRTPNDVLNCWQHKADYVTAPKKVIEAMLKHPATDKAIQEFKEKIDAWRS